MNATSTLYSDYRTPYYYNPMKFQNAMLQWRKKCHDNLHVLVIVHQPVSSIFSTDTIVQTIRDSLKSRQAQVVVYLSNYDAGIVSLLNGKFAKFMDIGQLLLLLSENISTVRKAQTIYSDPRDGFNHAYLLDLADKSKSNFTLIFPIGWRLSASASGIDYVTHATGHHNVIATNRKLMNDLNRTCWTVLTDNGDSDVILLDTVEHAFRLSVLLRSSLPYNKKSYSDLRDLYCTRFLSSAVVVNGPPIFTRTIYDSVLPQNMVSSALTPYDSEIDIGIPEWIDTSLNLGPRLDHVKLPYTIAFAVTAMLRPIANTSYLEKFMGALLEILDAHFSETRHFGAVIVVLVAGNTVKEIHSLHAFLENKFSKAIESKMIMLVDSPLESYTNKMSTMRNTIPLESHNRRFWRTKQNLDVGVLLRATLGLSEYVMLLEDDTGFQPEFASRVKSELHEDSIANHTAASLPWAQMVFGFGYSGILFRGIDIPVYAQLHTTFYDERPCDILDIWRLVRDGKRIYIKSPTKLRYKKRLYLKHLGVQSSLQGKTQEVW